MLTNPKWLPLLLDRLGREKKKKLWKSLYYIFFETMMLCWTRSTNLISFLQGLREPAHGRGSGGHPAWSLLSEEFQASEGHFTDRYGVHKNRCIRNSDPANFQKSKRLVLPRSQGQQTSVTSTAPLSFLCPTRTPLTELPSLFRRSALSAAMNRPDSAKESKSIYDSCPII